MSLGFWLRNPSDRSWGVVLGGELARGSVVGGAPLGGLCCTDERLGGRGMVGGVVLSLGESVFCVKSC